LTIRREARRAGVTTAHSGAKGDRIIIDLDPCRESCAAAASFALGLAGPSGAETVLEIHGQFVRQRRTNLIP
jgi:hypothetical protein